MDKTTNFSQAEFSATLNRIFAKNGLDRLLSKDKAEKLLLLAERMLEENQKYNLTAITDVQGIVLKHYADSVSLAVHLPKGASLLDVGTGAGFPTLPLAICRPDLRITALDSTDKRVRYVEESAHLLGLENVTAVTARAEDYCTKETRERFDFVTARAVAELRILCELCLPFCRVGGSLLAMKSKNAQNEVTAAKKAIAILGGKLTVCKEDVLTGDAEPLSRTMLKIDKIAKTPTAYPRPYAQISKKPL